jgi:hypothetical protein
MRSIVFSSLGVAALASLLFWVSVISLGYQGIWNGIVIASVCTAAASLQSGETRWKIVCLVLFCMVSFGAGVANLIVFGLLH